MTLKEQVIKIIDEEFGLEFGKKNPEAYLQKRIKGRIKELTEKSITHH